jgi:hypothetical protein
LRLRGEAMVYVLRYEEAFEIVRRCAPRWLQTRSWQEAGGYGTTSPSQRLLSAINIYRASPSRWREVLSAAAKA